MRTTTLVIASIIGLTLLGSAGCAQNPAGSAAPTPLPVVTDLSGITAEGRLEPVRFVHMAPAADGIVSEVLVYEGSAVQAGQVIARLDGEYSQSLESARSLAALELGQAYEAVRRTQGELDDLDLPEIFTGMTAEEAARSWLAEFDAANAQFAPYRNSSRKTLKPREAFQNQVYPSLPWRVQLDTGEYQGVAREYKKRVDVARMNYTKAVQWLQRESALASARATLADAQRRYDQLHDDSFSEGAAGTRAALAAAEIRAPFAGTVTNLNLKVGEVVLAGTPVATVADFSAWIIKTSDLTEIDVVAVNDGIPVVVALDAMPDLQFGGTVLDVDLRFQDMQGDVVYPASVLLLDSDPGMRWGMTAEVTFEE